jgi:hypothetical protein
MKKIDVVVKQNAKLSNSYNIDSEGNTVYRIKYISTTIDKEIIIREPIEDKDTIHRVFVGLSKIFTRKQGDRTYREFCVFVQRIEFYDTKCDNCNDYCEECNDCDNCGINVCDKCFTNNKKRSNDDEYDIILCNSCFNKRINPHNYKEACSICMSTKILRKNSKRCDDCNNAICKDCYISMLEKGEHNEILLCPFCRNEFI